MGFRIGRRDGLLTEASTLFEICLGSTDFDLRHLAGTLIKGDQHLSQVFLYNQGLRALLKSPAVAAGI